MIVVLIRKTKMKHYIFTIILFVISLIIITMLCYRVKLLEDCVIIQQKNIRQIVLILYKQTETGTEVYY